MVAPLAVVVTGPAGSGKTTLARTLATGLRAALLDLDTATAPLVALVAGLLGTDDLDAGALPRATRGPRYATLVSLARDCLACGTPVVVVGPFTRERADPAAWQALQQQLRAAGGRPRLVWTHVPPAVLRGRLVSRAAARDAAKLADLDAHLALVDTSPPSAPHTAVDTSIPVDTAALLRLLDTAEDPTTAP